MALVDSVSQAQNSATITNTQTFTLGWSHTVGPSAESLVVFLGGIPPSSVATAFTFDGIDLTPYFVTFAHTSPPESEILAYLLPSPPHGTHSFAYSAGPTSFTQSITFGAIAVSLNGAATFKRSTVADLDTPPWTNNAGATLLSDIAIDGSLFTGFPSVVTSATSDTTLLASQVVTGFPGLSIPNKLISSSIVTNSLLDEVTYTPSPPLTGSSPNDAWLSLMLILGFAPSASVIPKLQIYPSETLNVL